MKWVIFVIGFLLFICGFLGMFICENPKDHAFTAVLGLGFCAVSGVE